MYLEFENTIWHRAWVVLGNEILQLFLPIKSNFNQKIGWEYCNDHRATFGTLKVVANVAFKPITTRGSYDAIKAFTADQLVQKLVSWLGFI